MYTVSSDDDGSLQIQAPTLLRPLQLDAHQVQELLKWLNELHPEHAQQASSSVPDSAPQVAASSIAAPTETVSTQDAPIPNTETPETIAHNIIQATIEVDRSQHPALLDPENRDRLIDQVTRHPDIRPLLSKGKITVKQITLWVEQSV
ncbi:hypothetical protein KDI_26540 [Dictyobacter arantiisoli]|uniref:Uncharacterized protein n=2 Tax=Dictyobacter arantiisoli TaxID=2014874 RepID=A0A5A5TC56_9CHLR|nr:hypothetical protein KDI_26540 [Dictyobacter arantiisoli]